MITVLRNYSPLFVGELKSGIKVQYSVLFSLFLCVYGCGVCVCGGGVDVNPQKYKINKTCEMHISPLKKHEISQQSENANILLNGKIWNETNQYKLLTSTCIISQRQ